MQTLEDLFPGATGKLQVARIILRYGMPELARIRRDEQQWLNLAAEARRIALQVSQAQAAAAKAPPARS